MNETRSYHMATVHERLERYLSLIGSTPEASVAVLSELTGGLADSATEVEILEHAFAQLRTKVLGSEQANPAALIHHWVTQGGAGAAVDREDFEHRGWCYPPITRTLMTPPQRKQATRKAAASTVKTA